MHTITKMPSFLMVGCNVLIGRNVWYKRAIQKKGGKRWRGRSSLAKKEKPSPSQKDIQCPKELGEVINLGSGNHI